MMEYKGYTGISEVDEEAGIICGHVVGLRDMVTFQGETVPEVRQAFQDSVDDYLEFCAARGESPEKPFSGKFVVRVSPEIHRAVANSAEAHGTSLNSLIVQVLSERFLSQAANSVGSVVNAGMAIGQVIVEGLTRPSESRRMPEGQDSASCSPAESKETVASR